MAPIWPIIALLERQMVEKLLRSPAWHRGVGRIHKAVHELQHGKAPEDMGGTKLDNPQRDGFFKLFMEELKNGHKPEPKNKK